MYQADLPDIITHNRAALSDLRRALTLGRGQFSLILVRANYRRLTQLMLVALAQELEFTTVQLSRRSQSLSSAIETQAETPAAVMVTGFEHIERPEAFFKTANLGRNALIQTFPFPVVLWLTDTVLQSLTLYAADLKSFAAVPIQMDYPAQILVETLHRSTAELFTHLLDSANSAEPELPELEPGFRYLTEAELPFALADLQKHGVRLDGALQASLTFLEGRQAYAREEMEVARARYQTSLAYWQQTDGKVEDTRDQQAVLLLHLGLWWRTQARRQRSGARYAYQQARRCYEDCLEIFRLQGRRDRIATFIPALAATLEKLEAWPDLEDTATEALQLHQQRPRLQAKDYGYLAKVAIANTDSDTAIALATTALELLPQQQTLVDRHHRAWYLFLRSQAYLHRGSDKDLAAALDDLEQAQADIVPRRDFELYHSILSDLQDLYFARQRYLDAFAIKQEQRQIETMMGLRAFVGASPIPPHSQTLTAEMQASGRQQDIVELVDRLMQPQYTAIVIHGPSGVGKSSLISAGLVPALERATAEGRTTRPLVVRNYRSWATNLRRQLPDAPPQDLSSLLKQHIEKDYRQVVVIFDQFEEFFFERPRQRQRQTLYNFIKDCLNTPYLKVVLSLRDDYLHHLVELERLAQLDIDLLSRSGRYYLGNFAPKECEAVIRQLTENSHFYLEEELICTLVKDLAADRGEVRPIELQVVGAELQRENITTLRRYRTLGPEPVQALVRHFLDRVVRDCGPENSSLARTLLYLLSDENNIRPLKTRAELEEALESLGILAAPEQLTLVLKILTGSGLIFELPEMGGTRYQLVHDYLADLVQEQMPGLIEELQSERQRRQLTENQLRQALEEQALALQQATDERHRAETAEVQALASVSQALLLSHDGLAALLEALKGAQQCRLTPVAAGLKNQLRFRLWQALHTVREQQRLHAHQDWGLAVRFSPAGGFASASDDGTLRLWDPRGQLLATCKGHRGSVLGLAWSPDGQQLGSVGDDGTLRLWSHRGELLQTLAGHSGAVNALAFSPSGQRLATASNDHTVRLWSTQGEPLQMLEGHLDWVRSVDFSADGQYLVSAGEDGCLMLWDPEGEQVRTISSHAGWVLRAVFSPDSQTIASGGDDRLIRLWNLEGELLQYLEGHDSWVRDLKFTPDGQRLVSASDDGLIKIWDLATGRRESLRGHRSSVLALDIDSSGQRAISTSDDSTIRLWQLHSPDVEACRGHQGPVWDVAWRPQGGGLASAGADGTVMIWNKDGQLQRRLTPEADSLPSLAWSPDGQRLAAVGTDRNVRLWSATGELIHCLEGHQNALWAVAWSPDGQLLATAGRDRNLRLWHPDGSSAGLQAGHEGTVWALAFSPDGRTLASAGEDGTVRRWRVSEGQLQPQDVLTGHSGSVWDLAWSPDGDILASAGSDHTLHLWREGRPPTIVRGHHDWVRSVGFGLGGEVLVSSSDDSTVRFWDLSGQPLHSLGGHRGIIWQAAFDPSGNHLATAGADGLIRLWHLGLDQLLRQGCRWIGDYLTYGDLPEIDRLVCEDYGIRILEQSPPSNKP